MKRFELSTLSLARRCSTTELHPRERLSGSDPSMHHRRTGGQIQPGGFAPKAFPKEGRAGQHLADHWLRPSLAIPGRDLNELLFLTEFNKLVNQGPLQATDQKVSDDRIAGTVLIQRHLRGGHIHHCLEGAGRWRSNGASRSGGHRPSLADGRKEESPMEVDWRAVKTAITFLPSGLRSIRELMALRTLDNRSAKSYPTVTYYGRRRSEARGPQAKTHSNGAQTTNSILHRKGDEIGERSLHRKPERDLRGQIFLQRPSAERNIANPWHQGLGIVGLAVWHQPNQQHNQPYRAMSPWQTQAYDIKRCTDRRNWQVIPQSDDSIVNLYTPLQQLRVIFQASKNNDGDQIMKPNEQDGIARPREVMSTLVVQPMANESENCRECWSKHNKPSVASFNLLCRMPCLSIFQKPCNYFKGINCIDNSKPHNTDNESMIDVHDANNETHQWIPPEMKATNQVQSSLDASKIDSGTIIAYFKIHLKSTSSGQYAQSAIEQTQAIPNSENTITTGGA